MTFLLISNILSPIVATAVTQGSSEASTEETTENTSEDTTTNSQEETVNSEAETPDSSPITTEENNEPEQEQPVEEVIAEQTYEERELLEQEDQPSPHPFVKFEEKNLQDQIDLKGSLTVNNENKEVKSKTLLKKLVLQSKKAEQDWQEEKVFEIPEETDLQEKEFPFDYQSTDVEDGQEFRIVAEYVVEEYQEETVTKRTMHKGHSLIGELQTSDQIPSALGAQALPRVNYLSNVEYNVRENARIESRVWLRNITNRTFKFSMKFGATFASQSSVANRVLGKNTYLVFSTDRSYVNNIKRGSSESMTSAEWNAIKNNGAVISKPIEFDHTKPGSPGVYSQENIDISGLKPNTDYYMWIYAVSSDGTARDFHPSGLLSPYDGSELAHGYFDNDYKPTPYQFKTTHIQLNSVSKPDVVAEPGKATSLKLKEGNYKGDPYQNSSTDGIVSVKESASGSFTNKVTTMQHDLIQDGTYGKTTDSYTTIPGLKVGTKYKVRVTLKDALGNPVSSREDADACTPNNLHKPTVTTEDPTSSTNATANISGTYDATDALPIQNPSNIQVRIKKARQPDSQYVNVTLREVHSVGNATNKKISFKLEGLNSRTDYIVQYRVKNVANNDTNWSNWATSEAFTTGSVPLTKINKPDIPQTDVTSDSLLVKQSQYFGEPSLSGRTGVLQIAKVNTSNYSTLKDNIEHHTSFGSATDERYINATTNNDGQRIRDENKIKPGTKYKARWRMTDGKRNNPEYSYSEATNFITPNTVSRPTIESNEPPTNSNNATAEVTAQYAVDSGAYAAHPKTSNVTGCIGGKGVKVEIWKGSTGSFSEVSETSQIKIKRNSLSINNTSSQPNVSFSLEGLKSNTTYQVRVYVQNDSGVWSVVDQNNTATFTTRAINLSNIAPPEFDSITSTSARLREGRYSGDISQNANTGRLEFRPQGTTAELPYYPINHDIATDGNYHTTTIPTANAAHLTPGTGYEAQISFANYENNSRVWSTTNNLPRTKLITPNAVEPPDISQSTQPGDTNNATVSVVGKYTVGSTAPRHPLTSGVTEGADGQSGVKIELKSDTDPRYSEFTEIKTQGTPAKVDSLRINASASEPNVSFDIKGLKSNTNYQVKYRLYNGTEGYIPEGQTTRKQYWSSFSTETGFTTNPVELYIPMPSVKTINSRTAELLPGTYTGDATDNSASVKVNTRSGNGQTDWVTKINDPDARLNNANGVYPGREFTELTPGTRYIARVGMRDAGDGWKDSATQNNNQWTVFFTPNETTKLREQSQSQPTELYDATSTLIGTYRVSTFPAIHGQAHPFNGIAEDSPDGNGNGICEDDEAVGGGKGVAVQIKAVHPEDDPQYTDWVNLKDSPSENSHAYVDPSSIDIDISSTNTSGYEDLRFTISGLKANTKYYVRYKVQNASKMWSNYQDESPTEGEDGEDCEIETLNRPTGYYLDNAPTFDFGTIEVSDQATENPLHPSSGADPLTLDMENVGMTGHWSLTARLSELINEDPGAANRELAGAKIKFNKRLKKLENDSWINVNEHFDGLDEESVTLEAGNDSSTTLFRATDGNECQGKFQTEFDFNSVKLLVPGNSGDYGESYKGEVEWTMDDLP